MQYCTVLLRQTQSLAKPPGILLFTFNMQALFPRNLKERKTSLKSKENLVFSQLQYDFTPYFSDEVHAATYAQK